MWISMKLKFAFARGHNEGASANVYPWNCSFNDPESNLIKPCIHILTNLNVRKSNIWGNSSINISIPSQE